MPPVAARSRRVPPALVGAAALTVPGLALRVSDARPAPWAAAFLLGLAVVGAAFVLAWAAELVQLDVSQGLALAALALVAVLPEYAVDFVFTWKAGNDPQQFAPLALANMTGGNRLLIGIGWPLVVLLSAQKMRRTSRRLGYEGPLDSTVQLERAHAVEIGFLGAATLYSLLLPLRHTLTLVDLIVLVGLFGGYLVRISGSPAQEPDLAGPPSRLAMLPVVPRRVVTGLMFAFSAGVIIVCADPFAGSLVETGQELGVSTFLLVQWLAPLASEAPELIVAALFAWRLATGPALGTLISSKVNQWTLLVGTMPLVFAVSAGTWHGLPLDTLQRQELFLTAAQSLFAVAVLADRTVTPREAASLAALFLAQFVLGGVLPEGLRYLQRLGVGGLYIVLATGLLVRRRRPFAHLLGDAFRTPVTALSAEGPDAGIEAERGIMPQ